MALLIKPSFAKGELSPELHGRVDVTAYGLGLAKARNCIVHTYGGISRRPGLRYLAPVADHSYAPRLIPFEFKTTDQYVLEFGDRYMRVIRNDAHILESQKVVTLVEPITATRLTVTGHGYSNGDEVMITSVGGITQLNNQRFKVTSATPNTFRITHQVTQQNINTVGSTYTGGGRVARVYQITTPYLIADVPELNYVQSADVMTLTHKNYPIHDLGRFDHDDWRLTETVFTNQVRAPTGVSVTANTAGTTTVRYAVTATNLTTGEESLTGLRNGSAIDTISNHNPVRIETNTPHGFLEGDEIYLADTNGMPLLNNRRFIVTVPIDSTVFRISTLDGVGVDGSGLGTYTGSGGAARATFYRLATSADDDDDRDNTISWNNAFAGAKYTVFFEKNGTFGVIGQTSDLEFTDKSIEPTLTDNPPRDRNPFDGEDNWPRAVGYFEQRRVFGGSNDFPDTSNFSQIGRINNFSRAIPGQDDDAIAATLTSEQVNEIRHYVPFSSLMVFTSGSEWLIGSGQDNAFTPDTIRQRPQTTWGSSHHKPIRIGTTALFLTPDQANVRSIGYSFEIDGYTGSNLNTLSRHLLAGFTVLDWCYVRNPDSRIYLCRSDGTGLSLAFDQEQEVVAWTTLDTSGSFERCTSLRGNPGDVDVSYFVVKRRVNNTVVRYIETMRQSTLLDVKDAFFVDSGLSLDNPIAIQSVITESGVRVYLPTGHGITAGDEVDIDDIIWEPSITEDGDEVQPRQINGSRFKVNTASSGSITLDDLDDVAIPGSVIQYEYISGGTLRKAVTTLSGLNHLEGRTVVALADGNVVSNLVVEDGAITLPRRSSIVHVGLRNVCEIETLNAEVPRGTIQGKRQRINKVTVRFFNSRGLWIGPNKDNLIEMKQRSQEFYGDPTDMISGDEEIHIPSSWGDNGRMFLRNPWPLPLTVLALVPELDADD